MAQRAGTTNLCTDRHSHTTVLVEVICSQRCLLAVVCGDAKKLLSSPRICVSGVGNKTEITEDSNTKALERQRVIWRQHKATMPKS